jgi:hypothetical protein
MDPSSDEADERQLDLARVSRATRWTLATAVLL